MRMSNGVYFNIICEEMGVMGGKVIRVDENRGSLKDIHEVVDDYTLERMKQSEDTIDRIKWELHLMKIWIPEKRKIITYL